MNLAENFFRNFRRLFNRFPGFKDPDHMIRAMGLYQLGAKPERLWRKAHRSCLRAPHRQMAS